MDVSRALEGSPACELSEIEGVEKASASRPGSPYVVGKIGDGLTCTEKVGHAVSIPYWQGWEGDDLGLDAGEVGWYN